jgi:hypothetical protein
MTIAKLHDAMEFYMPISASSPNRPPGRRTVTWLACFAALFPFLRPAPALAAEPPPAKPAASSVEVLRESHWLQSLPDTITVPVPGSDGQFTTKRLADASVDDVALAANALSHQAGAILAITRDLEAVLRLARDAGAVGTSNAVAAAVKAKEAGR